MCRVRAYIHQYVHTHLTACIHTYSHRCSRTCIHAHTHTGLLIHVHMQGFGVVEVGLLLAARKEWSQSVSGSGGLGM